MPIAANIGARGRWPAPAPDRERRHPVRANERRQRGSPPRAPELEEQHPCREGATPCPSRGPPRRGRHCRRGRRRWCSPSAATWIIAMPVAPSDRRRPSGVDANRRSSSSMAWPKASPPTRPTRPTKLPRRRAATAWLAPCCQGRGDRPTREGSRRVRKAVDIGDDIGIDAADHRDRHVTPPIRPTSVRHAPQEYADIELRNEPKICGVAGPRGPPRRGQAR